MAQMFASVLGYEALMGRWSTKLAPLFLDFSELRDEGRLLDVGCGTGALSGCITSRTERAQVTGIDISESFVDYCRSTVLNPRVDFEQADACALPFTNETFDQTFSLLVVMFIPQPERAAEEMRRVTRPGGTVAACTWDRQGLELNSIFWQEAERLDPAAKFRIERPLHSNRPGQLEHLWRSVGLRDVVEAPLEMQMIFESFDDFWGPFLLGAGPQGAYVTDLSADQRDALRAALRDRLMPDQRDRAIRLRAGALAVRGRVPT